jgi:cell division protein ZapA
VTDPRTVVRVRIVGEEYTLRTDASVDHTRAVADHLDRTIRAIMAAGSSIEPHRAAILAALQITDELFRERGGAEQLAGDLRRLASEVRPLLPPAKRGDETDLA